MSTTFSMGVWALIANLSYAASQYAFAVAFSRLAGIEAFAAYVLGVSIVSPLFVLANMKLRTIQVTDLRDEFSLRDYLQARSLAALVALIAASGISLLSFGASTTSLVIVFIAGSRALETIHDTLFSILHKQQDFFRIALSTSQRALLATLGVVCVLSVAPAEIAAAMLPITYALALAIDLVRYRRTLGLTWAGGQVGKGPLALIHIAFPLGVSAGLGTLQANIPRFFLQATAGAEALAQFAASAYLFMPLGLVLTTASQVVTPRLSSLFIVKARREFMGITVRLVLLGCALGAGVVALASVHGAQLVGLLFGEACAPRNEVVVAVAVHSGLTFVFVFVGTALTSARIFNLHAPMTLATTVVVFTASAALIPGMGALGAGYALCCGALVGLCGFVALGLRFLRRGFLEQHE